jgi:hypothetical protein
MMTLFCLGLWHCAKGIWHMTDARPGAIRGARFCFQADFHFRLLERDRISMTFADILAAIPQAYTLYAALLILSCKIVTIFIRPPAATSHWAPLFTLVTTIGLNVGWATNRLQVGRTGIMVPRGQVPAAKAAIAAGVSTTP